MAESKEAALKEAAGILSDSAIKKTGYDLKSLSLYLKENKIQLKGIDFDPMLAAYLLNPSRSDYSIESIAWDYLKEAVRLTRARFWIY